MTNVEDEAPRTDPTVAKQLLHLFDAEGPQPQEPMPTPEEQAAWLGQWRKEKMKAEAEKTNMAEQMALLVKKQEADRLKLESIKLQRQQLDIISLYVRNVEICISKSSVPFTDSHINQATCSTNTCLHLSSISPDIPTPSLNLGSTRSFSDNVTHMPTINDAHIKTAIKDLLAADWSELPSAVTKAANKALSKDTQDKAAQETLKNVLLAAEAVEEFTGKLVSLRMEIDDSVGLTGEDVKPLPDHFSKALLTAFQRYNTYLEAFGPDEVFLRKKVENELGTRMIHLKMRCGGLGSEWGKITVLGTSGLSGSYVEHRA